MSRLTGDASPFVGRERELARLRALAEATAADRGHVVVISGEAGIGKTRLACELLAGCRARGFTVFSGAADELEQRRPFAAVLDALLVRDGTDARQREIVRLLETGGVGNGWGLQARVADLLAAIADDACHSGPVALLLDDLQWADESTLVAVHRLTQLAGSCRLLLLCALRPYPANAPLRALLAALDYRRAHRLPLDGLDEQDMTALATGLAGAPLGRSLAHLLSRTGGNPFYVSQLLACLQSDGAVVSAQGRLEVSNDEVPSSLRLLILDELRYLSEATVEVLRAAAVVGRAFSLSDVALLVSSGVSSLTAALAPAQQSGIVVSEAGRLAFRHDLVREAIYDDLAPAVRTALHRELAARLAHTGAAPERVTAHLMLGAEHGDLAAVRMLADAAIGMCSASPAIAAQLLERALWLAGEHAPMRGELLTALVRPLLWTGQAARAEQVCQSGLAAPNGEAALFWIGLATARLLQGQFQQARDVCRQAEQRADVDDADRLRLQVTRALAGIYLGEPDGLQLAHLIVATAPRSIAKGTAQEAIAQWELFTGHADRALAAYQRVDEMREPVEVPDRVWQGSGIRVRMWEALALLDLDRVQDAADLLERELAAKLSVPALPHAFLAACRYQAGCWPDAQAECRAAVAAAEAVGSFVPASALALAGTIALRQGRPDEAERLVGRAERARTPAEAAGDTIVRWSRTLLAEATGQIEQAADAAVGALAAYRRVGFASYLAWHAPDLVRVALAAGRHDVAADAVEAAEYAAGQLPVASRRAGALHARALLDGDAAGLLEAVQVCREVPRPLDLAHTLRDAAAALARAGEQHLARPLADEALELLTGLGAAGDERTVRRLLRSAGLALSARTRHARARQGWESLTDAELRVVTLLAEGRSTGQIAATLSVSRRTVEWHLANAFRKLQVSSRAELMIEALRHRQS